MGVTMYTCSAVRHVSRANERSLYISISSLLQIIVGGQKLLRVLADPCVGAC